jgi:hypothetical protein
MRCPDSESRHAAGDDDPGCAYATCGTARAPQKPNRTEARGEANQTRYDNKPPIMLSCEASEDAKHDILRSVVAIAKC